jgi:uncharacterized peroxidase-related enzyme
MAFLAPLPTDANPELADTFATFQRILGFVPNSLLTMQRKPKIVEGFGALTRAVMAPDGKVDLGFKRLIAHFCSKAAGCQYCMAHSLIAAKIHGISDEKVAAVWEYQTSPLYTQAERAALDYALAAGSVPNGVTQEIFDALAAHWDEESIVEILGVVCLYGFLNRWNDSMATTLEGPPTDLGQDVLAQGGWTGERHGVKSA